MAIRDLREIAAYIRRDSPEAARRWVTKLRDKARVAARSPGIGRIVPELGDENVREVICGSYRIVYRVTSSGIVILRFLEGHRQLAIDE